jgi:hypothetical protein
MLTTNVAYCDGGLGNRLATLFTACALTLRHKVKWRIIWPENNWCGANFSVLFSTSMQTSSSHLSDFTPYLDRYIFVMHENQLLWKTNRVIDIATLRKFDDFAFVADSNRAPIFLYTNFPPPFVDVSNFSDLRALLRPRADLLEMANTFIDTFGINKSVIGVHIRKTDFSQDVNDEQLFQDITASPTQKYYVCTDDAVVSARFSELGNCIVFPKLHYPIRLRSDGDWVAVSTDDQGRTFPSNISRSSSSVAEALIEMMILSKTTIAPTSGSTFLRFAQFMQRVNFC